MSATNQLEKMDSTIDFHTPWTPSNPQQDCSTFDPTVFGNSVVTVDINEEQHIWVQSGAAAEQTPTFHDADTEMELLDHFSTKMVMDPDLTANEWQANEAAMVRRISDINCDDEAADRADQNEVERLMHGATISLSPRDTSESVCFISDTSFINY
jgi:hypothetical protein